MFLVQRRKEGEQPGANQDDPDDLIGPSGGVGHFAPLAVVTLCHFRISPRASIPCKGLRGKIDFGT